MSEEVKQKGLRIRSSRPIKLKDKSNRQFVPIHILKSFGFVPEVIIIEKVHGYSNTFTVKAVLTEEEIKREDAELEKQSKLRDKVNDEVEEGLKEKGK